MTTSRSNAKLRGALVPVADDELFDSPEKVNFAKKSGPQELNSTPITPVKESKEDEEKN